MIAALMAKAPPTFNPLGVDFDGSTYLTSSAAMTGVASASNGIFSCWARLDGGDASFMEIFGVGATAGLFYIDRSSGNKIREIPLGSSLTSSTSFTSGGTWRHILSAWQSGNQYLYVTDVSEATNTTALSAANFNVTDYVGTDNTSPNTRNWNGCLAELYFAPGQYLDITNSTNRRKFITAGGRPVDLGSDGSTPTGSVPQIYLSVRSGGAANDFLTNRSGNTNFSVTAGSLSLSSTNP